MSHTPGPWKLCWHLQSPEKDAACTCGYRGGIFGGDGNGMVCEMGSTVIPGEEGLEHPRYERSEEISNAQLIAAAPELLEALESLLSAYEFQMSSYEEGYVQQAAREAIAKATGK